MSSHEEGPDSYWPAGRITSSSSHDCSIGLVYPAEWGNGMTAAWLALKQGVGSKGSLGNNWDNAPPSRIAQ